MPKRHGSFRLQNEGPPWSDVPWFLVGISDVFSAVAWHAFSSDPTSQERAKSLALHFESVKRRLAHSLDMLQLAEAHWEYLFNTPFEDWDSSGREVVGVAADSVMHYLSLFSDDIARIIPFVFDANLVKEVDSFGALKSMVKEGQYTQIHSLFSELDAPVSWWETLLKRGIGLRQRLVHYLDIIEFRGCKSPSADRFSVSAFLRDPFNRGLGINFIDALERTLSGMFSWLDRLESLLVAELQRRASDLGINWIPSVLCPRLLIPVDLKPGTRRIPANFLYLPSCEGSESTECDFVFIVEGKPRSSEENDA